MTPSQESASQSSDPPSVTPSGKPLERDEVLGGLSGRNIKQANTLLLLIETRTAQLLADSRHAAQLYDPIPARRGQAQAYLQTIAQGRHDLPPPTIRDLERYARQWAELVPDNVTVRAMTAQLLGEKYHFPRRMTPGIRRALGFDDVGVQQAYQQLYNQSLATIYSESTGVTDRLRWRWTRLAGWLENLSPFWTAFALTLTETVGAGVLALPIALAGIGPMAGVLVLLLLGALNVLTLASVAEAITRNGHMRYGVSYFGRLINDYLGKPAMIAFSIALMVIMILCLIAYGIGIATTLQATTGLPHLIWVALLYLAVAYVLHRRALDTTVASALLIGFINLSLILLLVLLTLPYMTKANLTYLRIPFVNGQPFEPGLLGLVFGTVLGAYYGHTSVGNMAKTVLRRDPSGRTLLWGNVAAMSVAILLYCGWILVVNGALSATTLAQSTGTVLIPLATVVGPAVYVIGPIFVVLGMGMASMHMAMGLFNQVQEWLAATIGDGTVRGRGFFADRGRRWLSMTPVVAVFIFTLWLLVTGRASFTQSLSFMGTIAAPLVAGVFPMLLLVMSRHMGDYAPAFYWRWLGRRWVVGGIILFFFVAVLLHGLFIWRNPIQQVAALVTSAGVLLFIALTWRRSQRQRFVVMELRAPPSAERQAYFQIVDQGAPATARVQFHRQQGITEWQDIAGETPALKQLQMLTIDLPATTARILKIWPHIVSPLGDSTPLFVHATLYNRGNSTPLSVQSNSSCSELLLPLPGVACQVVIRFVT